MALKKLRPITAGTRHRLSPGFEDITTRVPEKSLVTIIKKSGGRNNTGKMTMRYIGGGHKQKTRIIDFKRDKFGVAATVQSIEYDPTRTARVALLYYVDGTKTYIIAPQGLKVGQTVLSGDDIAPAQCRIVLDFHRRKADRILDQRTGTVSRPGGSGRLGQDGFGF